MQKVIKRSGPLKGEITAAADKSISHRAVIFSSLARGESIIRNFLQAADTLSSCSCMRQLGVNITRDGSNLKINSQGLNGLKEAPDVLDCGNSGTTMRLMTGLLAARPFFTVLSGDESLNGRPMKRVTQPLQAMGAKIWGRKEGAYPPLAVKGKELEGIKYSMPVASAQVKSALLLAGLNARGDTVIIEPERSRDHSENMLAAMGADIEVNGHEIRLKPGRDLQATEFLVPGDISSAAFFIVGASLVSGSELLLKDIGINFTRSGIIEVLINMGGNIKIENRRNIGGEEIADLVVKSAELHGTRVEGDIIPRLIDEIPILAVAMALAKGESIVSGASELRVKETDRIAAICSELGKMGVKIQESEDGFSIQGSPDCLTGNKVKSHGDHRIAMSLAIAALCAEGETTIDGAEAVSISFPEYWELLEKTCR
ncbi:3-phosphoshikimate 1-carboxyvinyltransferase [Syntrophomonas palmitatica]|uniref:3-phosphoshikimate 1-carboxyvinyltransferase n=1 Tax=Syntrophomonas palmitatica TaxID=402877 RepID=UPI0006D22A5C|nr:3-phosphoshikimate 1-carboxyvinyltransferase [Syntrophomonas palmitatica]